MKPDQVCAATRPRLFPKKDSRPAKGWWAPGEYLCRCCSCGEQFIGDKRAQHCADCAYAKGP